MPLIASTETLHKSNSGCTFFYSDSIWRSLSSWSVDDFLAITTTANVAIFAQSRRLTANIRSSIDRCCLLRRRVVNASGRARLMECQANGVENTTLRVIWLNRVHAHLCFLNNCSLQYKRMLPAKACSICDCCTACLFCTPKIIISITQFTQVANLPRWP